MTENPYACSDDRMIGRRGEAWNEGYAAGDIDGFKRYIHFICDILEDQMEERGL